MSGRAKTVIVLFFSVLAGYFIGATTVGDHVHAEGGGVRRAQATVKGVVSAPDFSLPDLSGKSVALSDFKGKWVFVNFWATWCGPCVMEMPMLNNMYHKLKSANFEMLAVSIDTGGVEDVRKFIEEMKVDFTVLHDRENITMKPYSLRSIPKTYMINPKGEVEAKADGMREWDNPEMIEYLRNLMGSKGETTPAKASPEPT